MWQSEFEAETNVSIKKIWSLWADVENCKNWNNSVEYSSVNGAFKNGTFGIFKSVCGSKFCLKYIVARRSFTSQSKLPLCTLNFVHEITNKNNVLKIKHE